MFSAYAHFLPTHRYFFFYKEYSLVIIEKPIKSYSILGPGKILDKNHNKKGIFFIKTKVIIQFNLIFVSCLQRLNYDFNCSLEQNYKENNNMVIVTYSI